MNLQLQDQKHSKVPASTDSDETNLAMNILKCINLEADNSEVLETLDGYFFKMFEKQGKKPKDNRTQFYKQVELNIRTLVSNIETREEFVHIFQPNQKLMDRKEFVKSIRRI